jgi:glycosyltransferase involved in cell wall biosynthesis
MGPPEVGSRVRELLFVETSPFPSYGGSKRVLVRVLPLLDRSRWSPHALFYRDGEWAGDLRRAAVPVTIVEGIRMPAEFAATRARVGGQGPRPGVPERRHGGPPWIEPRRWLRELRFLHEREWAGRHVANRLKSRIPVPIDLIHFNGSMDEDFGWYQLARSAGIPYVLHEHRPWGRRPLAWKDVARRASAVVCMTGERADIVKDFAGPGVRTVVIPNGVGEGVFRALRSAAEVRRELGIDPGDSLIVTAGYLQAWKGQHLAVEAAARLKQAGRKFTWLICGGVAEPDYHEQVRRLIRELGVEAEVRLIGDRSDLGQILSAADLVVHTSVLPEPFGLVVVEAMAAGTVVLGPAEGAMPELVRDGIDGRLFAPRDVSSMVIALTGLLDDPEARRRMGSNGRERVRAEFDLRVQVQRLERLYESILGGAGPPL